MGSSFVEITMDGCSVGKIVKWVCSICFLGIFSWLCLGMLRVRTILESVKLQVEWQPIEGSHGSWEKAPSDLIPTKCLKSSLIL